MNKIIVCIALFLLAACGEKEKMSPTVFFAGEIINPTNDYVVLYKGDKVIDSARLDANNRFSFSLDSISEGLHHFYHHPELQYIYFESGDSLQARLNTTEFDESLVFSGKGEEVNNFLLEMFLINESEEELVYSLYKLEPEDFTKKIDSLKDAKLQLLHELIEESELSEGAYEIARSGITYTNFISREAYPFYHKKKSGDKDFHALPAGFYDYRKHIDFENENLTYLRPYYNFMKYHVGNLSYMACLKDCGEHISVAHNQLHFNRHKLQCIDTLIKQKELRDNLFRNVAVDYLLKPDCEDNIKAFIEEFHQLSGNNKHIEEINNLYEGIKKIQPNKEIPDVLVTDSEDNQVSLKEIADGRQVVFYFWSGVELGHFKNIKKRVAKLKKKHPEYAFVGISLRTDKARWKTLVEANNLDKTEQFWAGNFEDVAHTLIVYDPFKSVIAKDGLIVDAFANVYTSF
ncbi:MAG: transaldolase [Bacteroidota bacterium]